MTITYETCTTCNQQGCTSCGGPTFNPSLTVARACHLIKMLLDSNGCESSCPDWELCRLLRLQCQLYCGRYNMASLAMMTAAKLLEIEAACFARTGRMKTLTVEIQADRTAIFLSNLAKTWKAEAMQCSGLPKFSIVTTGRGCNVKGMISNAYKCGGCTEYKYEPSDRRAVSSCNFDCCDDCPDEYLQKPI